ncbi:MAG: prepilin-type N-terminal cleavage/methylation domain-containing protein [Candidatus Paceibacterota bacterium]|jgi:prepilin-type N-terminal cleavage/methylation domain-containing protein
MQYIHRKGFTILEILIALAIMGILMAISVSHFSVLNDRQIVEKEAHAILGTLEQARLNAIASRYDSPYGVKFNSTSTVLFQGNTYDSRDQSKDDIRPLNSKLQINSNLSSSGGLSTYVDYSKITGEASATGTITIILKSATTTNKVITVYETGIAETN